MTTRTDSRFLDTPLTPVGCRRCGATVLARKSSWAQTSIQWDSDATARCPQRRDVDALKQHGAGIFLGCSDMGESIQEAAHDGALPIVDDFTG